MMSQILRTEKTNNNDDRRTNQTNPLVLGQSRDSLLHLNHIS